MTIQEVIHIMKLLHKDSLICFSKTNIPLPGVLNFNRTTCTLNEAEKKQEYIIKDGYLLKGNQIMVNYIDDNTVEICFSLLYCKCFIEGDIFKLWDFHKYELENLELYDEINKINEEDWVKVKN